MLRPMPKDPFVRAPVAAADQSIVACGAQQTVIAGYHWFSDWGREWTAMGCSPSATRACSSVAESRGHPVIRGPHRRLATQITPDDVVLRRR